MSWFDFILSSDVQVSRICRFEKIVRNFPVCHS